MHSTILWMDCNESCVVLGCAEKEQVIRFERHYDKTQKNEFTCWSCIEVWAQLLIPYCLCLHSNARYLVKCKMPSSPQRRWEREKKKECSYKLHVTEPVGMCKQTCSYVHLQSELFFCCHLCHNVLNFLFFSKSECIMFHGSFNVGLSKIKMIRLAVIRSPMFDVIIYNLTKS